MKRVLFVNDQAGGSDLRRTEVLDALEFARSMKSELLVLDQGTLSDRSERVVELFRGESGQLWVWGGDGTIHTLVNRLMNADLPHRKNIEWVIAPGGSGNDYYRSIGDSSKKPLIWYRSAWDGRLDSMDIGSVDFLDSALGVRYFVNIAGFGLSASVVELKERWGSRVPRSLRYILPTLANLKDLRVYEVTIETPEKSIRKKCVACFIAKGKTSGGGMNFGLHANISDGMFQVLCIGEISVFSALINFPKIFQDGIESFPFVEAWKSQKVVIRSSPPMKIELDGELVGSTACSLEVLRAAFQVRRAFC